MNEFSSELLECCYNTKALKMHYKNNRLFFDCNKLLLNPRALNFVAFYLCEKARLSGAQGIGGRKHGAEALVAGIVMESYKTGCDIPGFFVRVSGENYSKIYDGILHPNSDVIIIEPIASPGTNLQRTINIVEHHGSNIKEIYVLLERYEDENDCLLYTSPSPRDS